MQTTVEKTIRPAGQSRSPEVAFDTDLLLKLYELLQGERGLVRVYSQTLQAEICFVNPALQDPVQIPVEEIAYTTSELAFVLSLSEEEFRRFHYLKTRLLA